VRAVLACFFTLAIVMLLFAVRMLTLMTDWHPLSALKDRW
jgi:hypothetical protein